MSHDHDDDDDDDKSFNSLHSEDSEEDLRNDNPSRQKRRKRSKKHKNIRDYIAEAMVCTVCLDIIILPVTLDCGHSMCMSCYLNLLTRSMVTCPSCQQPMSCLLKENYLLSDMLEKFGDYSYRKKVAYKRELVKHIIRTDDYRHTKRFYILRQYITSLVKDANGFLSYESIKSSLKVGNNGIPFPVDDLELSFALSNLCAYYEFVTDGHYIILDDMVNSINISHPNNRNVLLYLYFLKISDHVIPVEDKQSEARFLANNFIMMLRPNVTEDMFFYHFQYIMCRKDFRYVKEFLPTINSDIIISLSKHLENAAFNNIQS